MQIGGLLPESGNTGLAAESVPTDGLDAVVCWNCKKTGHRKADCPKLPATAKADPKGKGRGRGAGQPKGGKGAGAAATAKTKATGKPGNNRAGPLAEVTEAGAEEVARRIGESSRRQSRSPRWDTCAGCSPLLRDRTVRAQPEGDVY